MVMLGLSLLEGFRLCRSKREAHKKGVFKGCVLDACTQADAAKQARVGAESTLHIQTHTQFVQHWFHDYQRCWDTPVVGGCVTWAKLNTQQTEECSS